MEPITDLMIAGDLRACAGRAIAALEGGVSDFRAVSGFLLGIFNQRGPEALPELADVLAEVLAKHWHSVRPESHRDRVVDSCLVLFFRVLRSSIEFHESRRDEEWQRWVLTMPADLGPSSLSALRRLSATLTQTLAKPCSLGELDRLCARAESLFRPKPPCPAEDSRIPMPADLCLGADAPPTAPDPQAKACVPMAGPEPAAAMNLANSTTVSPQFHLLLRKLAAFATLVARSQMAKAAIVAADLSEIMDHFDPRAYFPALFAPHLRMLNEHIDQIAPHWNRTSDPAWQILQQLYGVDLDAFMESK